MHRMISKISKAGWHFDNSYTRLPKTMMSRFAPVQVKKPKLIPAVTHVDGTARVQTVNKKQNKIFYNLIKEFKKITGIGALLNTVW